MKVLQRLLALIILVPALTLLATGVLGYWITQPPAWLRWFMSALAAGSLAATTLCLLAGMFRTLAPAQAARLIEQNYPFLGNGPINAVLLAQDNRRDELVERALQETAAKLAPLDLRSAVSKRLLRRRVAIAAGIWLVLLLGAAFQPQPVRRSVAMLLFPGQFARHQHDLTITHLSPGDTTIYIGQPVTVQIVVGDSTPDAYGDVVLIIAGNDQPIPMPFTPGVGHQHELGPVAEPMQYAIRVGRRHYPEDRPWYTISVMDRWSLDIFEATVTYPPYTGRPDALIEDFTGTLSVPQGSSVSIVAQLAPSPAGLYFDFPSGSSEPLTNDGTQFSGSIHAAGPQPIQYRLLACDDRGEELHAMPAPGPGDPTPWFVITPVTDAPPALTVLSPGTDLTLAPAESLTLRLRATDDHGLNTLTVYAAAGDATPVPIVTEQLDNAATAVLQIPLDLSRFEPHTAGQEIRYFAAVTDSRRLGDLGPQQARSPEHRITFQTPEAIQETRSEQSRQLIEQLEAILAVQIIFRVDTQRCALRIDDLDTLHAEATKLVAGQQGVAVKLASLVNTFPFSAEQLATRQALEQLATGPAPEAIIHARSLRAIATLDSRMRPCNDLAGQQDAIIRKLQTLLALALGSEPGEGLGQGAGSGNPSAGEDFQDTLKSFTDAQSQAVDAAQALADGAGDGVGADDIDALNEARARHDDAAQFLEDLIDQARALPKQDFDTEAILQELISIQTDVTMAENALAKDAVKVAAGLEANALAKAENLESELEKWLADTPDRASISLEPVDDLAAIDPGQLPEVLEDLIGDLLEQEEDLFGAIEDETSAAATSSREGIGWETADGPVSSMTGEGVTGNVLPNANEIAGRGGDGRSGQASGEFIEDSAQGAEGRRTGTRLADDPVQDGAIDDTDPTPAGGATGGGRLSGAGGAGLEGPTPEQTQRLEELLDRQIALINQARQIDELASDDFVRLQMLDAITLMKAVQNDLGRYSYRNALRHRDATLQALTEAHVAISGASIVLDASSVSLEVDSATIHMIDDAELPDAHRQQLRAYYRKLSRQDGNP